MNQMHGGLGLEHIEGIDFDADHSSVYQQTQPLFLGHFQESWPPVQAAPAAAGTPPPASALWSIVYTQEASFHYKGTPSEQGSDSKGLKGTFAGIGDPKAASATRAAQPSNLAAVGNMGGGTVSQRFGEGPKPFETEDIYI